jgi:hypothetical protein
MKEDKKCTDDKRIGKRRVHRTLYKGEENLATINDR